MPNQSKINNEVKAKSHECDQNSTSRARSDKKAVKKLAKNDTKKKYSKWLESERCTIYADSPEKLLIKEEALSNRIK